MMSPRQKTKELKFWLLKQYHRQWYLLISSINIFTFQDPIMWGPSSLASYQGVGQDHVDFVGHNAKLFYCFPCRRRLLCAFNASWAASSKKRLPTNYLQVTILYNVHVLSSYHVMYVIMQPHREYQRTDADFSNTLKYLVSGKEVNRTVTCGILNIPWSSCHCSPGWHP